MRLPLCAAVVALLLSGPSPFAAADDEGLPPPPRKARTVPKGFTISVEKNAAGDFVDEHGAHVSDNVSWFMSLEVRPDGSARLHARNVDLVPRNGTFEDYLTHEEFANLDAVHDELRQLPEPTAEDQKIPRGGRVNTFKFFDAEGRERELRVNDGYVERVSKLLAKTETASGISLGGKREGAKRELPTGIAQRLDRGGPRQPGAPATANVAVVKSSLGMLAALQEARK